MLGLAAQLLFSTITFLCVFLCSQVVISEYPWDFFLFSSLFLFPLMHKKDKNTQTQTDGGEREKTLKLSRNPELMMLYVYLQAFTTRPRTSSSLAYAHQTKSIFIKLGNNESQTRVSHRKCTTISTKTILTSYKKQLKKWGAAQTNADKHGPFYHYLYYSFSSFRFYTFYLYMRTSRDKWFI